jgi:hypothetical protein
MSCCTPLPGFAPSRRVSPLLEALVNAPAAYGMAPQALASVVRISTDPRIYVQPGTLEKAIEFCRLFLAPETCTVYIQANAIWDFVDL